MLFCLPTTKLNATPSLRNCQPPCGVFFNRGVGRIAWAVPPLKISRNDRRVLGTRPRNLSFDRSKTYVKFQYVILNQHDDRIFDHGPENLEEMRADGAVEDAMVTGEGDGHHRGDGQLIAPVS